MKVMLLSRITFLLLVQVMPPRIIRQVDRLLAEADPQVGGLGVSDVDYWAKQFGHQLLAGLLDPTYLE